MGWWTYVTSLFRADPASRDLYEKLHEMLTTGKQLFEKVTLELVDPDELPPEREEVYRLDARINVLQSEIRRRLPSSASACAAL